MLASSSRFANSCWPSQYGSKHRSSSNKTYTLDALVFLLLRFELLSGCNSGLQIYIRRLVDIRVSESDVDGKSTSLQGSVLVRQSLQLLLLFRSSHCERVSGFQYSDVREQGNNEWTFLNLCRRARLGSVLMWGKKQRAPAGNVSTWMAVLSLSRLPIAHLLPTSRP